MQALQATKEARQREPAKAQPAAGAASAAIASEEHPDITGEVNYLLSRGWTKIQAGQCPNPIKRWLDPETGKPDRKVLVVQELRDIAGRIEKKAVYQNVVGVPAWHYSRTEAVGIQRDRDAAQTKGKK